MGVLDKPQWRRLVAFFEASLQTWRVRFWTATLELTKAEKLHAHVMLQFQSHSDHLTTRYFFEGLWPRADPNDVLGDGWSRRKLQDSLDRAFFYVWAEKNSQVTPLPTILE